MGRPGLVTVVRGAGRAAAIVLAALLACSCDDVEPTTSAAAAPTTLADDTTVPAAPAATGSPEGAADRRPGARALLPGVVTPSGVRYLPRPRAARSDLRANAGCSERSTAPHVGPPVICEIGASDASLTIAVVGGSHMSQWRAALDEIADDLDVRFVTLFRNACRFSQPALPGENEGCRDWLTSARRWLLRNPPDAVIVNDTYYSPSTGEIVPDGYTAVWKRLADKGVALIGIRDNPRLGTDMATCVRRQGAQSAACRVDVTSILASVDPAPAAAEEAGLDLHHVDMTPWTCPDGTCRPVIGNVFVWRDSHHLTDSYVRTLAPMLADALRPTVRDLRRTG